MDLLAITPSLVSRFQLNNSSICCRFAEEASEVHNADCGDRPRSSPADRCSFEKEEAELEGPPTSPAHREPSGAPMAPTQPYYLNGELPVHLSPIFSCPLHKLSIRMCDYLCVFTPRAPHGRIRSLLQAVLRLGAVLLQAAADELHPHGAAAHQQPVRPPREPQPAASAAPGLQHALLPHLRHLPLYHLRKGAPPTSCNSSNWWSATPR